jgi:hypothetical protein
MLGDVSVHISSAGVVRQRYPNAYITCVCNSEGFPIQEYLSKIPYFA